MQAALVARRSFADVRVECEGAINGRGAGRGGAGASAHALHVPGPWPLSLLHLLMPLCPGSPLSRGRCMHPRRLFLAPSLAPPPPPRPGQRRNALPSFALPSSALRSTWLGWAWPGMPVN
jgi:hypothetical protein